MSMLEQYLKLGTIPLFADNPGVGLGMDSPARRRTGLGLYNIHCEPTKNKSKAVQKRRVKNKMRKKSRQRNRRR